MDDSSSLQGLPNQQTILIADDDPALRTLLSILFNEAGFNTQIVADGFTLVQQAQHTLPDLMLIDVMMPDLDGYEALRQLRNDTRTAHIPAIMLTARAEPDALVLGFDSGADDYVVKPFDSTELLARVRSHLRRAARRPVRSPLTGLPGNVLITEEIRFRIRQSAPFAMLYIDLNNFKAFNDTYGFARGDRVIRLVSEVLGECISDGDFLGHIGGDDFVLITTPERIIPVCRYALQQFNERVQMLYEPSDLKRGYLLGHDRQGVPRRFPLSALSISVATNQFETFSDPEVIGQRVAAMKQMAKNLPSGGFILDGTPQSTG